MVHTGTALTIQIFQLDTNDDGISLDEIKLRKLWTSV